MTPWSPHFSEPSWWASAAGEKLGHPMAFVLQLFSPRVGCGRGGCFLTSRNFTVTGMKTNPLPHHSLAGGD